jgi:hypothetical protein
MIAPLKPLSSLRGEPLEKWQGGGYFFNLYEYMFLKYFACVDNYFKYNPLHKFFFISTYNFPYWKLFWCMNFFSLFPLLDFNFVLPPITFLMVRPLQKLNKFYLQKNCKKYKGCSFFNNVKMLKCTEKLEVRLKQILKTAELIKWFKNSIFFSETEHFPRYISLIFSQWLFRCPSSIL